MTIKQSTFSVGEDYSPFDLDTFIEYLNHKCIVESNFIYDYGTFVNDWVDDEKFDDYIQLDNGKIHVTYNPNGVNSKLDVWTWLNNQFYKAYPQTSTFKLQ